jgi:predicted DNA-binding transcriptional regulator AlpA
VQQNVNGGSPELADVLATLEAMAPTVDAAAVPGLVIRLGAIMATMGAAALASGQPAATGSDRMLDIHETATRTGMSEPWLYRNQRTLPFARKIGRKLVFSEAGLDRWLKRR